MKNRILKKLHKLLLLLIFIFPLIQSNLILAEKNKIHSLPIKSDLNKANKFQQNLAPMPMGDINTSSKKVNYERNPFQKPSESEFSTMENLYKSLRLKGLAKADNKLFAIIEIDNNQKFYKVGDKLKNGFTISLISLENVAVDISNGSKKFKLILANLKNHYENK
tara:strand:+ start:36 stop:530 length:495 start_codon:yes stop_codon:yes gene_type:complete